MSCSFLQGLMVLMKIGLLVAFELQKIQKPVSTPRHVASNTVVNCILSYTFGKVIN